MDGLDRVADLVSGQPKDALVHGPDRHLRRRPATLPVVDLELDLHLVARALLGGVRLEQHLEPLALLLDLELHISHAHFRPPGIVVHGDQLVGHAAAHHHHAHEDVRERIFAEGNLQRRGGAAEVHAT